MGKRALLAKLLQDIRASYWFLPTVLVVAATILVQVTLYLDHHTSWLPQTWQTTQVAGARATLSVMAQSIIGVAGVMFSLTIVAVSFASGNFGPRLIGNFMQDRGNQWSLGILIATFVYALLILRAVQSPYGPEADAADFVPHLSLLVAFALTGISIMAMIFYVHHIPEIINVSNISADLGARLRLAIERLIDTQADHENEPTVSFPKGPPDIRVCLLNDGYVQTWNRSQLRQLADENDLYIKVQHAAGAFISTSTPVLDVWGGDPEDGTFCGDLRDCFAIGSNPTETQNVLFVAQQLVEMIARALSPGINDPYTAINCVNWIYVGLGTAANYKGGLQPQPQPQGRVEHPVVDFEKLLVATVEQALPYICSDKIAAKHLDKIIAQLVAETENETACAALTRLQKDCDQMEPST